MNRLVAQVVNRTESEVSYCFTRIGDCGCDDLSSHKVDDLDLSTFAAHDQVFVVHGHACHIGCG